MLSQNNIIFTLHIERPFEAELHFSSGNITYAFDSIVPLVLSQFEVSTPLPHCTVG